ncbi:hypothetical protein HUJ05_001857, partial [Dendroctonus ponderosae]
EITGSNIFTAISQPCVSRCITEVTDSLNQPNIFNDWVKFPETIQEMESLRRSAEVVFRFKFYEKYQFPGVIGLADCTHVAIAAPTGNEYPEHIYVNRKHYHSINVQLVRGLFWSTNTMFLTCYQLRLICNEKLEIMNVDGRFQGSCHYMHIWKQNRVAGIVESVYRQNTSNVFYLLGYSVNVAEERFDSRIKAVRSGIEKCNGVLKNRFRCLLKHRVLHYRPDRAGKIINACVVLHNMCVKTNMSETEENPIEGADLLKLSNMERSNDPRL